jgi:hypothetical protein
LTGRLRADTVCDMIARRSALALLATATLAAWLGAATPAGAHSGVPGPVVAEPAPADLALSASREPPGVPWALLVGVIAAAGVARRHPRRAVGVALVLVLAVFAFEDGLHSVHHGADRTAVESCAVASAAAHLAATAVDPVAPSDAILAAVEGTVDVAQAVPVARLFCPDQGRAPPSRL